MLRSEFNQYLQWVGNELDSIKWGERIEKVSIVNDGFDVAVIGGGQSGAEIVLDLLNSEVPSSIHWISARRGILPIDESHFSNEWYTPAYVDYFWNLSTKKKTEILAHHTLSSDGVSPETIEELYQKLYKNKYLNNSRIKCNVMHSRLVEGIEKASDGYLLNIKNLDIDGLELVNIQKIILATGYKQRPIPEMVEHVAKYIEFDGDGPVINKDFSLKYSGAGAIYVVNSARATHGVADPNLSLNAWRAATIVNSILKTQHYKIPQEDIFAQMNFISGSAKKVSHG